MGTVYRATDPQINRQVAVKTISISDPVRRARFQREVRAAGGLTHPHIVTIFDAGEEGHTAFIVMELVEGETLAARLQRGLTWRQAVSLLLPVCQAVAYAHSQGITHRDLKPANILITRQDVPKLTDFGLAHLSLETSLTPVGAVLGTPAYSAPEQLRGEPVDHRSDIFSLGIILFEAITGQHPFATPSVGSTLHQILRPEPVSVAPLADKAPPALTRIIGQALAKERAARHATTADLAAALAECLSRPDSNVHRSPSPQQAYPNIRYTPSVSLSLAELSLCAKAFDAFQGALIERELRVGFSGARVLLVRPGGGQAPVVVKLGPLTDLHREWTAYQDLVKKFLPQNTARIEDEPISSDDDRLALLRYTFAGGDPRRSTSLRLYFQEQGGQKAAEVLDRVVRRDGRHWWAQNATSSWFALSEQYDRLLPVHLLLEKVDSSGLARPSVELVAGKVRAATWRTLSPGQLVHLRDFTVAEVSPERGHLTLTAPPLPGETSAPLRLRVTGVDPLAYHPRAQIPVLDAMITDTRHTLLTKAAQAAIPGLDVAAAEIRVGEMTCPNPLRDYVSLLDHSTQARVSIIHGDLNLENILVDSATGFAWLIDFAETRQGPALFDLQRLESQIITKILAPTFEQSNLGPVVMVKLYQALHADLPNPTAPHPALQEAYILLIALRRLARQFLINDLEWDEYYRGLILTLLGTLKYPELSSTARAVALAGAGAAKGLLDAPLPLTSSETKPPPVPRWPVITALAALLLMIAFVGAAGWWRAVTHIPPSTPTPEQTLLFTPVPVPNTPTSVPASTLNPPTPTPNLPTPTPLPPSLNGCEAQIIPSGGTIAIARVSAYQNASERRRIRRGTNVIVVEKSADTSPETWYLVQDSNGLELGWILGKDVELSPQCIYR
ncbi:MAG: hypothetical protein DPW09_35295 [Anaerolineae bacterium]|nr:hypothetical protein [Anaerolineae bacterium]